MLQAGGLESFSQIKVSESYGHVCAVKPAQFLCRRWQQSKYKL